jgi:hypothetical protein
MKRHLIVRSLFSVLLMASFLLSMTAVFSTYFTFFHRVHFQTEIKSRKETDLLRFSFTEKEFKAIQWEEVNREFQFKGKMYDVSSIEQEDGRYIIHCENDSIEDMLLSLLKLPGQKTKSKSPQLQLSEAIDVQPLPVQHASTTPVETYYSVSLPFVSLESLSPPPKDC